MATTRRSTRWSRRSAAVFGFEECYSVTGQTYPRKVDRALLPRWLGSRHPPPKMAHGIRLLSHLREFEEPFEKDQVGSSEMPYKRNPMRSDALEAARRMAEGERRWAVREGRGG